MKGTKKTSKAAKRPATLRITDARDFLAKYKQAWEERDPELAASLFTRDARYQVNPFAEPIVGREAIHDYWAGATSDQEDIRFAATNCVHSGYVLAVEWTCNYRDRASDERKELAGMFFADFYGKQVRHFREYYQSRRELPQSLARTTAA